MRHLQVSAVVVAFFLAAGCGITSVDTIDVTGDASPDAPDASACPGTPPVTCQGCCGNTYAADQCVNGAWTCVPLGEACAVCDGGSAADAGGAADGGEGADEADATNSDAADGNTCPGDPPLLCNGCCGSKYAADQCVNGTWTCRPLAIACVLCDAGGKEASVDAAGGCGLAGQACCPGGDPGMAAIAPCNLGLNCCTATNTCSGECNDAAVGAPDASELFTCGLRDDGGVAHSGTCPDGQFCCDQSHTGATGFVCRDNGLACVPVP